MDRAGPRYSLIRYIISPFLLNRQNLTKVIRENRGQIKCDLVKKREVKTRDDMANLAQDAQVGSDELLRVLRLSTKSRGEPRGEPRVISV
jgi:DNA-binding phage protein